MRPLYAVLALLACYVALQWHDDFTARQIAAHDRAEAVRTASQ